MNIHEYFEKLKEIALSVKNFSYEIQDDEICPHIITQYANTTIKISVIRTVLRTSYDYNEREIYISIFDLLHCPEIIKEIFLRISFVQNNMFQHYDGLSSMIQLVSWSKRNYKIKVLDIILKYYDKEKIVINENVIFTKKQWDEHKIDIYVNYEFPISFTDKELIYIDENSDLKEFEEFLKCITKNSFNKQYVEKIKH